MSIHKTSAGTYRVRWREVGRLRSRTFKRKVDAEQFQARMRLGEQHVRPVPATQQKTLAEVAQQWVKNYAEIHKFPSSVIRDKQMLRDYILPTLGSRPIQSIEKTDILAWQGELKNKTQLALKTINLVHGLLAKILHDAVDWGFIDKNPTVGVKRFRLPEIDFKFWSMEERDRFLNFAKGENHKLWEIIAFTVHTGLRSGEVEGLLRDALDFERREVVVKRSFCHKTSSLNPYTKGKNIRRVPMNSLVWSILQDRRLFAPDMKIFSFDFEHLLWRYFRPLQRKAGVQEIRFHDLRHTFASHLAMAGVSLFDIQKLLGHAEIRTTMRYMHLAPDQLQGKTDVLLSLQLTCRRSPDAPSALGMTC